ncbi:MAG TPA: RNA polymerase sigma factor [Actinomycetota bacterium]|nr:RNA polymerase sigma factor [Actinomycetota bacterium]
MDDDRFAAVLSAARTGDSSAWEEIYKNLSPIVMGYLRSRRAPDPEDLVGAVFLDLVRNLSRFQGNERDFRTWTLTIAHRRLVDALRKAKRRDAEIYTDRISEAQVPSGDTETEALDQLGSAQVRELLGGLSPDQQDVLLLRILGDLTIDETAEVLGKRPGAVKALQRRGLAALKRKLGRLPPYP